MNLRQAIMGSFTGTVETDSWGKAIAAPVQTQRISVPCGDDCELGVDVSVSSLSVEFQPHLRVLNAVLTHEYSNYWRGWRGKDIYNQPASVADVRLALEEISRLIEEYRLVELVPEFQLIKREIMLKIAIALYHKHS